MTRLIPDIGRYAGSLARRIEPLIEWHVYRRLFLAYAEIRRPRLNGVTFIGITGSAGKTLTKELTAAILESHGNVKRSPGTANRLHRMARIITETQASDACCVLEFGAERPGCFDPMIRLARPMIGVVTTVGKDHFKAFGSQEAIAAEKGKLIAALPPEGTAVLNADDPLVWAMRERCKARVVSFGLCNGADLKAHDIRSAWPERLSFTVHHQGKDYPVQTQLYGRHWVTATLAALAAGVAAGIPLAQAAQTVARVPPAPARMEPVTTPEGVTFLRDDWKASLWTMPTIFDFLREAKADRKIAVIGTLSDYHGTAQTKYKNTGRDALKVADIVLFVGSMATHGLSAQKFASKRQILAAYPSVEQAYAALQDMLRPGDLVVLKGSGPADHLGRLYHARTGPVACWRMDCGKISLCEDCRLLRPEQSEPSAVSASARSPKAKVKAGLEAEVVPPADAAPAPGFAQVFIGIGNPGEEYRNTPHNVGFDVLDILAERHGAAWENREDARIARLPQREGDVLLVKPQKYVNNIGKVVLALSKSMGFTSEHCVLVHDDIHLPIGKVRTRLRGSDGGHLGVRSMLVAFQTGDIRRVKVGVGSAGAKPSREYLLSPFPPAVAAEMNAACTTAADHMMKLAKERQPEACDA